MSSERAASPTTDAFQPAWWLPGPHAQTIWPAVFRPVPPVPLSCEPVALPDGDHVRLYWGPIRAGALVLLLHGLGGCAGSPYIRGQLDALARAGFQGIAMEFRGAAGEPNRRRRFYHAGDWADPDAVVAALRRRYPDRPLCAVGYSLGASVLLNWLIAHGRQSPLAAAVAISTPFDLAACADHIDRGFARVYQAHLLACLRRLMRAKFRHRDDEPWPLERLGALSSLRMFDDRVTAPLHGFAGAADYYARASTRDRLDRIHRPTLLLQAADDPFIPAASLPDPETLPPTVDLELTTAGGHVGFVEGAHPVAADYWLERRVPEWLRLTVGGG